MRDRKHRERALKVVPKFKNSEGRNVRLLSVDEVMDLMYSVLYDIPEEDARYIASVVRKMRLPFERGSCTYCGVKLEEAWINDETGKFCSWKCFRESFRQRFMTTEEYYED